MWSSGWGSGGGGGGGRREGGGSRKHGQGGGGGSSFSGTGTVSDAEMKRLERERERREAQSAVTLQRVVRGFIQRRVYWREIDAETAKKAGDLLKLQARLKPSGVNLFVANAEPVAEVTRTACCAMRARGKPCSPEVVDLATELVKETRRQGYWASFMGLSENDLASQMWSHPLFTLPKILGKLLLAHRPTSPAFAESVRGFLRTVLGAEAAQNPGFPSFVKLLLASNMLVAWTEQLQRFWGPSLPARVSSVPTVRCTSLSAVIEASLGIVTHPAGLVFFPIFVRYFLTHPLVFRFCDDVSVSLLVAQQTWGAMLKEVRALSPKRKSHSPAFLELEIYEWERGAWLVGNLATIVQPQLLSRSVLQSTLRLFAKLLRRLPRDLSSVARPVRRVGDGVESRVVVSKSRELMKVGSMRYTNSCSFVNVSDDEPHP